MSTQLAIPRHIEITETTLRLYVFLTQYLDRCQNEVLRLSFPEHELQAHLSATLAKMSEILAVTHVVKGKIEQECDRVLSLGVACLTSGTDKTEVLNEVKAQRAVLQNKTVA